MEDIPTFENISRYHPWYVIYVVRFAYFYIAQINLEVVLHWDHPADEDPETNLNLFPWFVVALDEEKTVAFLVETSLPVERNRHRDAFVGLEVDEGVRRVLPYLAVDV